MYVRVCAVCVCVCVMFAVYIHEWWAKSRSENIQSNCQTLESRGNEGNKGNKGRVGKTLSVVVPIEQNHGMECPAAQRAAWRLRPHPRADGLDDALAAKFVMMAGQQLKICSALHADNT